MTATSMRKLSVLTIAALILLGGTALAGEGGGRLLMTIRQQNHVLAATPDGEILGRVPVGVWPSGMTVHEGLLYVANRGPGRAPGSSISVVDLDSLRALRTLYVCESCAPTSIAFDGDDNLWFTAQNDRAAYFMNPPYEHPSGSVILAWGWPTEIEPLPGLPRLIVGMRDATEFAVIDTRQLKVARQNLGPAPSQLMRRAGDDAVWVFADTFGAVGRMAPFADDKHPDWEAYEGAAAVYDGAFASKGSWYLQSSLKKNRLILSDAENHELLKFIEHDEPVGAVVADPHGMRFAVALPTSERVGIFAIDEDGNITLESAFEVQGAVNQMLWLAD